MSIGTTSKNVHAAVYKWIHNKTQPASNNHISDRDGSLLTDPAQAIFEVQNVWDDVFGADAGHQDPHKLLSLAWPAASKIRQECHVPPLPVKCCSNRL